MADKQTDVRAQLVQTLVDKVDEDQYPSTTMMDTIEEMLTPTSCSSTPRCFWPRWPTTPTRAWG